jgi:tetratricopeptide (TPR) repeat protein
MTRFFGALLLAPVLALPAMAGGTEQDTVKLKNGRVLSGIVLLDDANREGFTVQRWDTGGTVFVRWTQITDLEHARLSNRVADIKLPGVMLDGVRAMTAGRDVVGVLVKEDANGLHIKTKDSKSPVQIPKSALLRPHETLKIPEADAYSSDEMIDQRVAKADEKSYASMLEVGVFAASVKLYERAKEFYQKAAAVADAKGKEDIEAIIAKNEGLIKEGKASALVAQVKELVETIEFAKAVETAKKLLSEFGDTEVARQNKDLVSQLEKKAKDYESKRVEYLAENVPQAYKDRRTALFSQYGSTKNKIAEALAKANKIDEEVVAELAKRMKATPEEINAAWGKRELKPRTVTYGDGSWIVKGGQDGGLDTDAKTQPNQPQNKNNGGNNGGFGVGGTDPRRGGNMGGGGGNNKGGQPNQPQALGKKLETKDEWWATASSSDRRNFVEAEYAKNSGAVKKEVKMKKCSVCNGEGIRKEIRQNVACDCKCLRCHGSKDDDIVIYQ